MELLKVLNDFLWNPLVVFVLGFGFYLTIKTSFLQIRGLPHMLRLVIQPSSGNDGISSFQALALSLSSRVGVGSIAGVATAITVGGPGSLFWMAVMAILGGATAFVESTLAQIYKTKINGVYVGGIPYYIERGLGTKKIAVIAATVAVLLYAIFAPGIQSNNIGLGFESAFEVPKLYSGIAVTAALAFIIFGGRKRLIHFVEYAVPFMAGAYILAALIIVLVNIELVPSAIKLVLSSAVGLNAIYGGIVGSAIAWGVRRALFANVAGVGEGTFASAAADVSHPVKQGLVQCFSIYIDTLFVCMATGVMIIITGQYNVITEAGVHITTNLPGIEAGPAYAQAAINTVFNGFGAPFVAAAIALFAFTTLVAFYYIAETNLSYLLKGYNNKAAFLLKLVLCAVTFYGSIESAKLIWAIGDVGYASLAWVNMICLVLLAKPALKALKDYDQQRKMKKDPIFDPKKLGIPNTDSWDK
ncbi:alanine/glycine:cation symporter family protein [Acinetobacter sp. ABJ_C1_1]|uniref:alanine/glycine:cation symporter family protein n=1 Tax=Acinetobacter sp. ABJ_C1_1 TaxID=3378321 RepID=UPI00264C6801|nr:alanine/glycine:cation symporter family protein [Acinetobacter baumannii]